MVGRVWAEDLWVGRTWDEGRDAKRIRSAFHAIRLAAKRFPTPRDLLENLPAVESSAALDMDEYSINNPYERAHRVRMGEHAHGFGWSELDIRRGGWIPPVVSDDAKTAVAGSDA